MIDQIRAVAVAACGTLIITAVLMMLMPSAAQSKVLRLSVSLFFLLSLASPFVEGSAEWREDSALWEAEGESITDFQSLTEQQLLRSFEERLEAEARGILKQEGITPLEVHFSIHTSGDGSISITSLEILLDQKDTDRCSSGIAKLNEAFGLTAVLAFSESEGGEG